MLSFVKSRSSLTLAASALMAAVVFLFCFGRLSSIAAPIYEELANVGLEDFTQAVATPPASALTLKVLLGPDEARGALSVEEQDGRTLVTLLPRDLFASGSATPNAAYDEVLQHVGDALNRVPGRVLVVGHTDDQPLASLRYRDNYELSRERALGIVRVLQARASNAARFEFIGAGSSQPRYQPVSDPENRARNRRVEIICVR